MADISESFVLFCSSSVFPLCRVERIKARKTVKYLEFSCFCKKKCLCRATVSYIIDLN